MKTSDDTSIIKQGSDDGRDPHVSHKRLGHQILDDAANMALQAHVQDREISILTLSYGNPVIGNTVGRVMGPIRTSHNRNFGT
jgi:hypothetical protein